MRSGKCSKITRVEEEIEEKVRKALRERNKASNQAGVMDRSASTIAVTASAQPAPVSKTGIMTSVATTVGVGFTAIWKETGSRWRCPGDSSDMRSLRSCKQCLFKPSPNVMLLCRNGKNGMG